MTEIDTPCCGCGGTGDYWDKARQDWGNVDCPDCNGSGTALPALVIDEREFAEDFDAIGERFA